MRKEPDTVKVFVYGTLRSDAQFWGSSAVTEIVTGCSTQGRIYDHGYPVAKFGQPGRIIGEIQHYMVGHPTYVRMCTVELGAGYVEEEVTVLLPSGDEVEVTGWHYAQTPQGVHIPHGDFVKWIQEQESLSQEIDPEQGRITVRSALRRAEKEGLAVRALPPQDIAADLIQNDTSVRHLPVDVIVNHIYDWQESQ